MTVAPEPKQTRYSALPTIEFEGQAGSATSDQGNVIGRLCSRLKGESTHSTMFLPSV